MNGLPESIRPYYNRKDELTAEQGCALWGIRVVIPEQFRKRLLNQIHEEHPGICKTKTLARCYLWWPTLDRDIETKVKSCTICMAVRNTPQVAPLHSWQWPTRIWQRLHIDFAQKWNHTFLVIIDSHSKWLEVFDLKSTTAEKTCDVSFPYAVCFLWATQGNRHRQWITIYLSSFQNLPKNKWSKTHSSATVSPSLKRSSREISSNS